MCRGMLLSIHCQSVLCCSHVASQKWVSSPQKCLPNFRVTNTSGAIRQLDQTVVRAKWRNAPSWWCPTRSLASIINASEISAQRPCGPLGIRTTPSFVFFWPPALHICQICLNLLASSSAPSLPCQFTRDRPSVSRAGHSPRSYIAPTAVSRAGAHDRGSHLLPKAIRRTLLTLALRPPATGLSSELRH